MEQSPSSEATVQQLVYKLPAFYENRRYVAAFRTANPFSLSWASLIQSMSTSQYLKIHFNNILPQEPKLMSFFHCLRRA